MLYYTRIFALLFTHTIVTEHFHHFSPHRVIIQESSFEDSYVTRIIDEHYLTSEKELL